MSNTKTNQTPPQSPQDVPRTSETPKPGFDCRKASESFLGLRLDREKRAKALEELLGTAVQSGYDLGYRGGESNGRLLARIDADKLAADTREEQPPAKRIRSLFVRVSRVDTQHGCRVRLSFPEIPGLHFVSEYPSKTETGFETACYSLAARNGDVLDLRPL